jgi:hypothetical protein
MLALIAISALILILVGGAAIMRASYDDDL